MSFLLDQLLQVQTELIQHLFFFILEDNHLFIHLFEFLFSQGMHPLQFFELTADTEVTHVEVVKVFVENCVVILEIFRLLHKISQFSPCLVQFLGE